MNLKKRTLFSEGLISPILSCPEVFHNNACMVKWVPFTASQANIESDRQRGVSKTNVRSLLTCYVPPFLFLFARFGKHSAHSMEKLPMKVIY